MMASISQRDIVLPDGSKKLAFILDNVLSKEECDDLIKKSHEIGYEAAMINLGDGRQAHADHIRRSGRCIWDTVEVSTKIWHRIKGFLPSEWKGCKVLGLNERLRVLHYTKGQYFKAHFGGSYERDNLEWSALTFQLYLNEGFEGGATTFLPLASVQGNCDPAKTVPIIPRTGSVLIFEHHILHEGSELLAGEKYTIRSDVMFEPPAGK